MIKSQKESAIEIRKRFEDNFSKMEWKARHATLYYLKKFSESLKNAKNKHLIIYFHDFDDKGFDRNTVFKRYEISAEVEYVLRSKGYKVTRLDDRHIPSSQGHHLEVQLF